MQVATVEQFASLSQFLPMGVRRQLQVSGARVEGPAETYRILILEGSVPLARLLATGLSSESVDVDVTHDLSSALSYIERCSYNLLLLDLDLDLDSSERSGPTLVGTVRSQRPEMRVMVLSGRTAVEGMVAALDQGADDYLMKPFSLLEMMARVRALRRRSSTQAASAAVRAPSRLVLHREQCRVERDGRAIDLTPREFSLLEYMMRHEGETLTRASLTLEVWNMPVETNTNIVDVYVKYLRDKLDGEHGETLIRTVRGRGYVFQMQG